MSSKRSQWGRKGQQPLLPVMDPCEGAQPGAAETLEALHSAPCKTFGWRCPGLAGWHGKTSGGCGEKGSDEH